MKREAVQEERQRNKEGKSENEVESSTMCAIGGTIQGSFQIDMSFEKILNAELKTDQRLQELANEVGRLVAISFSIHLLIFIFSPLCRIITLTHCCSAAIYSTITTTRTAA